MTKTPEERTQELVNKWLDADFFGLPITGSNMSYDRTKRKGTELEVTARPLGDLLKPWVDVELRGSWTHINAEFRGNEGVMAISAS